VYFNGPILRWRDTIPTVSGPAGNTTVLTAAKVEVSFLKALDISFMNAALKDVPLLAKTQFSF
jgi:hypothetical protein